MRKIFLLLALAAFVAAGCSSQNQNGATQQIRPMPANNSPPSPDNPPNRAPVP